MSEENFISYSNLELYNNNLFDIINPMLGLLNRNVDEGFIQSVNLLETTSIHTDGSAIVDPYMLTSEIKNNEYISISYRSDSDVNIGFFFKDTEGTDIFAAYLPCSKGAKSTLSIKATGDVVSVGFYVSDKCNATEIQIEKGKKATKYQNPTFLYSNEELKTEINSLNLNTVKFNVSTVIVNRDCVSPDFNNFCLILTFRGNIEIAVALKNNRNLGTDVWKLLDSGNTISYTDDGRINISTGNSKTSGVVFLYN